MKPRAMYTVLLACLVPAAGLAADAKRMPANACLLEYDSENQGYDRGAARIGTYHMTQVFTCPLIRSNTTNANGLAALKLNVYKYASTHFTCYAHSFDTFGSAIKIVSRDITTTGLTAVDWGSSLNQSGAWGTYGVTCYVVGVSGNNLWGDELESIDYTEY